MKELNKNIQRQISYNCMHATFLIEKKQFNKLTLMEHFSLKLHLAGCPVCRIFSKQSLTINRLFKNIFHEQHPGDFMLDDHFKKKLQQRIDQYQDRNSS